MSEAAFSALPLKSLAVQGESDSLKVGDRVRIQVEGVDRAGARVALAPSASATESAVDAKTAKKEPLQDSGVVLLSDGAGTSPLTFELAILSPGNIVLPSLAVIEGPAEAEPFARTQPLRLQAESAIAKDDSKPTEAVPLKDPVRLPYPTEIVAVGGALALLVAFAIGYSIWRWIKKWSASRSKVVGPPKTEDEVAIEKLAEIERAEFAVKREFKKHYFGISETLKTYVGLRYGFDAPEMTSEEIISRLRSSAYVGDKIAARLSHLLGQLDLVKFTDKVPDASEPVEVLAEARRLVQETRRPRIVAGSYDGGPNAIR